MTNPYWFTDINIPSLSNPNLGWSWFNRRSQNLTFLEANDEGTTLKSSARHIPHEYIPVWSTEFDRLTIIIKENKTNHGRKPLQPNPRSNIRQFHKLMTLMLPSVITKLLLVNKKSLELNIIYSAKYTTGLDLLYTRHGLL